MKHFDGHLLHTTTFVNHFCHKVTDNALSCSQMIDKAETWARRLKFRPKSVRILPMLGASSAGAIRPE